MLREGQGKEDKSSRGLVEHLPPPRRSGDRATECREQSTGVQTDSGESSPGSVSTGACTCRCRLCNWGTCASHP